MLLIFLQFTKRTKQFSCIHLGRTSEEAKNCSEKSSIAHITARSYRAMFLMGTQFRTFQCAHSAVAEETSETEYVTPATEKYSVIYAATADIGSHDHPSFLLARDGI